MKIISENKIKLCVMWTVCFVLVEGQRTSSYSNQNNRLRDVKVFKLPTPLQPGHKITIEGTFHVNKTLKMELTSKIPRRYHCRIIFEPTKSRLTIKTPETRVIEYYTHHGLETTVVFVIRLRAMYLADMYITDMVFESNESGEYPLGHCEMSHSEINGFLLSGVKQVNILNFQYGYNDE